MPPAAPVQGEGSVILTGVPTSEAPVAQAAATEAPVLAPEIIPAAAAPAPVTEAPAPAPAPTPAPEPAKEEKKGKEKKEKKEKTEKTDKEKKPFNPLLIILLVVGIAIGEESGNEVNPSNNEIPAPAANSYRVLYKDYLFDVPKEYDVQVYNNVLYIIGDGITYAVELKDNSYDTINNNKSSIKNGYESSNYKVNNMEEKYYGSANYLVFDMNNGNNIRVFFRQNNATSLFIGVIKKADEASVIDDGDLSVIDGILSSASVSTHRSNGEESGKGDSSVEDAFGVFDKVQLDPNATPVQTEEKTEETPQESTETQTVEEQKPAEEKTETNENTTPENNNPVEQSSGDSNTATTTPNEENTTTTPASGEDNNTPTDGNSGEELPATTGE